MPQSLMLNTPLQAGSSKRQRSADSRGAGSRAQSGSRDVSRKASKSQLRPNIRIPSFLDKSRAEISTDFHELEWKQRFRIGHAIQNPETSPYRVDRSDIVISRNRYGNVQPWDQSRIRLKTPIGGSDYVNASPIVLRSKVKPASTSGNESSTLSETRYIASQGPKQDQYSHFWHMVHQETSGDTGAIIMLTQLYEGNKEKCSPYFPMSMENPTIELPREEPENGAGSEIGTSIEDDGEDPFFDAKSNSGTDESEGPNSTTPESTPQKQKSETSKHDEAGSIDTVTLLSLDRDNSVGCEIRNLKLTINNEPKKIVHYLFGGWPDFGRPEAEERKALIELTRKSKQVAQGSPRVVHCSAGVGRTGTWIALDFLTREIDNDHLLEVTNAQQHNEQAFAANTGASDSAPLTEVETWGKSGPDKVSTPTDEEMSANSKTDDDLIYDTVNALREQRMMMVMNELQYFFLYETVKEVFLEKYKAKPEGAIVKGTADSDTSRPKSKAQKVEGSNADGIAFDEILSEAETEVMETETVAESDDPYAAVAPESIRQGISREE